MIKLPYGTPPRWWPPQPRPIFTWLMRRPRLLYQRRVDRLVQVSVRGLEHVRAAVDHNQGVLITPKHVGHGDAFVMLNAADQLGRQFYYMVNWQTFQLLGPLESWVLRTHGCFSVDRESNDLRAFRLGVDIVQRSRHPLVVFAEGEIYHNNDWVAPFRPGAAAIALAAAQRADRPVVGIPAAIVYRYVEDPLPALLPLMTAVEDKLHLPARSDLPLAKRAYRAAKAILARHEQTHLGSVREGRFADRVAALTDAMLTRLEERLEVVERSGDVPARATCLRQHLIKAETQLPPGDPANAQIRRDFAEIERTMQLYSYMRDYDYNEPSLERLGEILDKFEEDVLGAPTAHFHVKRRATILFGEPIAVKRQARKKEEARALTAVLETEVQKLVQRLGGTGSTGYRLTIRESAAQAV